MTTVRGLADALGLSPATVSRSLNHSPDVSDSVRERVLAEAERCGYALPRKRVRSRTIGLMFLNETSGPKFSGYDATIWGGVTRAAMAQKYDVRVIDPLDRGEKEGFGAFAARKGVEALVLRVDEDTRHFCSAVAAERVPHVVIADRFEDDPRVNYVCCNSFEASRAAIEHLLHLGHRRIGVCHNYVLDTDHCDRIKGYRAALADGRIEVSPELIIAINAEIGGGAAALNRLLSLPEPPTAIFCIDPALTVGALRRASEVGIRVPDELSVVGMDDERLRKMTHPVFTAVCQNASELGSQAVRWLCRHLSQPTGGGSGPATMRVEIEAFLEINETTASPPSVPVRITPTGQRLLE
jgi:DNA-binding LacI/PurR family transcriptional regulator